MTAPGAEPLTTRVVPELSVRRGRAAVEFYERAFGAVEEYRVGGTDDDEAVVAQLAVGGATFWVADESPPHANHSPESLGGATTRILLIVDDPRSTLQRAVEAGATEVLPVREEHQWLLGRVVDPFGHHWEIGKPLVAWPPTPGGGAGPDRADEGTPIESAAGGEPTRRVLRPSGVSYLHIPAPDPAVSAAFYRAVFAWTIRDDDESPAFEDGTGHVIGHFVRDLPVAGYAGHVPHIYVESLDETLQKVEAHGGTIDRQPFPEGDLWVAMIHDPAGNRLGVWQQGPRP